MQADPQIDSKERKIREWDTDKNIQFTKYHILNILEGYLIQNGDIPLLAKIQKENNLTRRQTDTQEN